jgi:hypothetical protein
MKCTLNLTILRLQPDYNTPSAFFHATSMRANSANPPYQKHEQCNKKDGPNNPKAFASSTSGIPVIAASAAEQQHEKNN